jgi:hypothetical protein
MTPAEMRALIADVYPECLLADGFEGALIGMVERACQPPVACYDYGTCVEILTAQGLSQEEAHEHLAFNVMGAYVGSHTPAFLMDWRGEAGEEDQEALE